MCNGCYFWAGVSPPTRFSAKGVHTTKYGIILGVTSVHTTRYKMRNEVYTPEKNKKRCVHTEMARRCTHHKHTRYWVYTPKFRGREWCTHRGGEMTNKTVTKTIRMDSEVGDWLADKDARAIIESVCELEGKGKLKCDDEGVHIESRDERVKKLEEENKELFAKQLMKGENPLVTTLKECAEEKGIDFEGFVDSLHTQLIWGMLEYRDGKVIAPEDDELKVELDNLRDACEEKNENYLQAIRKTAQQIWSKRM